MRYTLQSVKNNHKKRKKNLKDFIKILKSKSNLGLNRKQLIILIINSFHSLQKCFGKAICIQEIKM